MKNWEEIYKKIPKACHFLEFLMAGAVFIGFLLATWKYFVVEGLLFSVLTGEVSFNTFLEIVLGLVIGIEFLKMFCAPDSENVIEVLIFMVARHMIVGENKPIDLFLTVLAVCLLCIVRVYLHEKEKGKYKTKDSNEAKDQESAE